MLGEPSEGVVPRSTRSAKPDEFPPEAIPHRVDTLIKRASSYILGASHPENIAVIEVQLELEVLIGGQV